MSERFSLSDHNLLAAGVHDLVLENAAHDRRLERLLAFHRRCEERADDSRFPGSLTLTDSVDRILLADHRLTLAARSARASGDPRTLEQLRTDLAVDLILGETVPGSGFARPVINVTVPIQTLMGVSDDPGHLSGGTVLPATLARMIARRPGSTWHRMLTDETGRCVGVSTRSYSPTRTIWNDVVARYGTCFRSGCDRPAADCELTTGSLPGGRDQQQQPPARLRARPQGQARRGFAATGTSDDAVFHTRAGFRHPVLPATQPTGTCLVPDDLFGFQYSATEIVDALTHLAAIQHAHRPGPSPLVDEIWSDAA